MRLWLQLKSSLINIFAPKATTGATDGSAPGVIGFVRAAAENEIAVVSEQNELVLLLDRVDAEFRVLGKEPIKAETLSRLLLQHAHACFLSAAHSAMGGQSPTTLMILRGCIESALYAIIVATDPSTAQVWYNRHKDKKRCRDTFTPAAGLKILAASDSNLEKFLREAYDLSIDYGGHPNPLGVLPHLTFDEGKEQTKVTLAYLYGPTSMATVQALIACVETGNAVLLAFPHALPSYPEAVEVHRRASKIQEALGCLINEKGWHSSDGEA
jgi:hypothetical protein